MRTLCIRHVPDEVAARLETLAAQAGMSLSSFVLQELTEAARRDDESELVGLPWDSFFLHHPRASSDFLDDRCSQEQPERAAI